MEETGYRLDQAAFDQAVEALHGARTIYVHGPGAASALSALLHFRLNRLGIAVRIMAQSGHELLEQLVHAGKADVVFMFGFVKSSPEAEVILEQAPLSGYRTVLMTDMLLSDLLTASDIVLQVDRGDADVFHSLVAPLTIVESLTVAVARLRGEPALNKLRELHDLRKHYASKLPK